MAQDDDTVLFFLKIILGHLRILKKKKADKGKITLNE